MKQQQSITSLPASPRDERRSRMIRYSVTMTIRLVCLICVFFVSGWWMLIFGLGAVVLPYFAVILANAGNAGGTQLSTASLKPGGVVAIPEGTAPRDFGGRPE
jgi:predicted tellurium resistance membrane protein TerC